MSSGSGKVIALLEMLLDGVAQVVVVVRPEVTVLTVSTSNNITELQLRYCFTCWDELHLTEYTLKVDFWDLHLITVLWSPKYSQLSNNDK